MHRYNKMQPFEELGNLLVPREQFTSDKYEQASEKRSRHAGNPMVPMSGASPVCLVHPVNLMYPNQTDRTDSLSVSIVARDVVAIRIFDHRHAAEGRSPATDAV